MVALSWPEVGAIGIVLGGILTFLGRIFIRRPAKECEEIINKMQDIGRANSDRISKIEGMFPEIIRRLGSLEETIKVNNTEQSKRIDSIQTQLFEIWKMMPKRAVLGGEKE